MNRKESELAYSVAEEYGGIYGGILSHSLHVYSIIKLCCIAIVARMDAANYGRIAAFNSGSQHRHISNAIRDDSLLYAQTAAQ